MNEKFFQLKTHLFPAQNHYSAGKCSPLSILAFQVSLMDQFGNLGDDKAGIYFFRDHCVPRVRACTFPAWDAICGLGNEHSPMFYVPFLPAIRFDEEAGIAGSIKGVGEAGSTHLPTLTRKSKLHIRDSSGRIVWGAVYIGDCTRGEDALVYQLNRSDIPETMVLPRAFHVKDPDFRVAGGLRSRMEFLAKYGIPAIHASDFPLAPIKRVLFQFTNQNAAAEWAKSYVLAREDVKANGESAVRQDYAQMLADMKAAHERQAKSNGVDGTEKSEGKAAKPKKVNAGKLDISI